MKKNIIISLIMGLILTVAASAIGASAQQNIAKDVLRLHIIANSNSEADQALKLIVRDGILKKCMPLLKGDTIEEVKSNVNLNIDEINKAAQEILAQNNSSYGVVSSIEKCRFPTKNYGSFALPAGKYDALRIVIGEGKGENWWCVMFPPLCLAGATDNEISICQKAGIDENNISLMTAKSSKNTEYEIKFKLAELADLLW